MRARACFAALILYVCVFGASGVPAKAARTTGLWAEHSSGKLQANAPTSTWIARLRTHAQARRRGLDPESLCIKQTVLSIEDPIATKYGSMRGWMTQPDWGAEFRKINATLTPYVQIGIDGFPCAKHGCCQHRMTIRPGGSDWMVVQHAINEYAEFLKTLTPWQPMTILEGGGNIGVATSLFAFLYPEAKIVVLEPDPENCELLKNNTKEFPNVVVECVGLWNKDKATVQLVAGGDGQPWAYQLREVPRGTPGALRATSVPALLRKHGLEGFDMAKIDIEGAEFNVFGEAADLRWLKQTKVMMLELHWQYGDILPIRNRFTATGFLNSKSGEYEVFKRPEAIIHRHVILPGASTSRV